MRLERIFTHRLILVLRYVVPVVVAALVAILAWNYWWRSEQEAAPVNVPKLSRELSALTEGFTFSRTEEGRTVFSIRAKTNLGFKDSKNLLEDVEVIVYGDAADPKESRIRSKQCDYDQQNGNIRFFGDVEVVYGQTTSMRTEELTYNHSDRLIEARRSVQLKQPGVQGSANRLRYWLRNGLLNLSGDVRAKADNGVSLETASAILNRKDNTVTVAGGIRVDTEKGWVRGAEGRAELEPGTLRPRALAISGSVVGEAHSGNESWNIGSGWVQALVSEGGRAETVAARANVVVRKTRGKETQILSGAELDASLSRSGEVDVLEARGEARMVLGPDQVLRSERIRSEASGIVSTIGDSVLEIADSTIQGRSFTIEQGDIVRFHTGSRARLKSGDRESSADRTEARFDSRTNQLLELVQTGNFQLVEGSRRGQAERARVDESRGTITLEENSIVSDSQMRLEASQLVLNQKDDSFVATQNVKTIRTGDAEPLLATAERVDRAGERLVYTGSVHLWHGNAYIHAGRVEASMASNELHASGNVKTLFDRIRVWSKTLDYDEKRGVAHYRGEVRAQTQDMAMSADDVIIHLRSTNEIRQIVAGGQVVVNHSGRRASGAQAVYEASPNTVTLIGENAEIIDRQGSVTRGRRLTVHLANDSIAIDGEPGFRTISKHRVQR